MSRNIIEHVRLDQDEENELLRLCETLHCSKSDVFRHLLKYKVVYGKPPLEFGKLIAELIVDGKPMASRAMASIWA